MPDIFLQFGKCKSSIDLQKSSVKGQAARMLLPLITGTLPCKQTSEYHELTFSSGRCRYLSNGVLFVRVAQFVPETMNLSN